MVKELKLLAEALWESIKTDINFFSPIQVFVKRLTEANLSEEEGIKDAIMYAEKIEEFFKSYRSYYVSPRQAANNDNTAKRIYEISRKLKNLTADELKKELLLSILYRDKNRLGGGKVFIGHGRSQLWARVQLFLQDDLKLNTVTFESESRTSETIVNVLEDFLNEASFAILIMTAEDETSDGKVRARQNVIHEAGLFQGRLGFDKVVILKQTGTEDFSNIAGLQYIPFSKDNIEQCFYEIQRKLKKSGMTQ